MEVSQVYHTPKVRSRKSSSSTSSVSSSPKLKSPSGIKEDTPSSRREPTIIKRRNSHFVSTSSPWFRRNSFLSPSMIQNENFSVYEAPNFYSESSSTYNIISLRECQGFLFNQDLFATPYQQSKSLAQERKVRELSFSKSKSKSRSNSRSHSKSKSITPSDSSNCINQDQPPQNRPSERRHTSYHAPRPSFLRPSDDSAIIDDDDEDDEVESNVRAAVEDIDMEMSQRNTIVNKYNEEESEESEDDDDDDDDGIDDDDEDDYEEMHGYGGDSNNRRYKVHVTEIIVDEADNDIFPN
ncbi:protein whose overexpression suppresses the synthetic lethality of the hal3 sit4 double mutation [Scheffersomyces coipomensis]|uniref:protein whose overexpression suppresses the synthetic lethality of the hal3 sit4 double mutation n=1 Tax=Scheffersomyces coipomensis TaxID=1788519 RepID=UPI00315CCF68